MKNYRLNPDALREFLERKPGKDSTDREMAGEVLAVLFYENGKPVALVRDLIDVFVTAYWAEQSAKGVAAYVFESAQRFASETIADEIRKRRYVDGVLELGLYRTLVAIAETFKGAKEA